MDLGSLVFPEDGGRRGADHITDDVSVIALLELLQARSVLEADLFCTESINKMYLSIHRYIEIHGFLIEIVL